MMSADTPPMSVSRKMSAASLHRRHERNIRKDIEHMQRTPDPIIPFTSFSRVVHEILGEQGDYSIRHDAVQALQSASEDHLTDVFSAANNLALYSGRETVSARDLLFMLPSKQCEMLSAATEECSEPPQPVPDQ